MYYFPLMMHLPKPSDHITCVMIYITSWLRVGKRQTWTVGTIHYDMSPLRSVLRSGRRKMNVERPVLRLWYPKMIRFTFGVL